MRAISMIKPAVAVAALLVLGSCADQIGAKAGFQSQYFAARTALEQGKYATARQGYGRLISRGGPLAPRLELEFAHTELRDGNYPRAAELAAALAERSSGAARAAALAVQGTAQHEQANALLQAGEAAEGKRMLQAAQAALSEVVATHPDLDPLGAMAGRQAAIAARLKRL